MGKIMQELIDRYKSAFGHQMHVDILSDVINVLMAQEKLTKEYESDMNKYPPESAIHLLHYPDEDLQYNISSLLEIMKFVTAVLETSRHKI